MPQFSRLQGGPVSRARAEDLEKTMAPLVSRHAFHAAKATAATRNQGEAKRDKYNLQNPRPVSPGVGLDPHTPRRHGAGICWPWAASLCEASTRGRVAGSNRLQPVPAASGGGGGGGGCWRSAPLRTRAPPPRPLPSLEKCVGEGGSCPWLGVYWPPLQLFTTLGLLFSSRRSCLPFQPRWPIFHVLRLLSFHYRKVIH